MQRLNAIKSSTLTQLITQASIAFKNSLIHHVTLTPFLKFICIILYLMICRLLLFTKCQNARSCNSLIFWPHHHVISINACESKGHESAFSRSSIFYGISYQSFAYCYKDSDIEGNCSNTVTSL